MPDLDGIVERAGRWAAARHSRRSFLGKVGRAAVLVAGGPALVATLLADDAEARVCGQSGVSAQCPTFDCPDGQWGWCWYSTGCCTEGLLKKICDCCVVGYPNVRGYCPPGSNVKCIVESCGTDPRVQTTQLKRLITDDRRAIADAARRHRYPNGSRLAVIGDAADPVLTAVATALASLLGAAPIHVAREALDGRDLLELDRLGVTHVYMATPFPPPDLVSAVLQRGMGVEQIGSSTDVAEFSGEVATWVGQVLGRKAAVVIEQADVTPELAALAGAFACATFSVVTFGIGTPRANGGVYLLGPTAASLIAEVPTGVPITAPDIQSLSTVLARMIKLPERGTVVMAPVGSPVLSSMAIFGQPIVLHSPGTIDGARDWLIRNAVLTAGVCVLGGHLGSLGLPALRELQSILNGFNIHSLRGGPGEGLPVYPQPLSERPPGRARLGTDPPPGR